MSKQPDFDAVVIGAGITGMYQLYKLREQGFKDDIFRVTGWIAMAAPAKMPNDVLQRVSAEVRAIVALPETQERINKMGMPAKELHGDLSQSIREKTLKSFADGRTRVLIATDVASRGIDLEDIGLVVNFDPADPDAALLSFDKALGGMPAAVSVTAAPGLRSSIA